MTVPDFSLQIKFFFINFFRARFLYFNRHILTDCLSKVRIKLTSRCSAWFIILPDYTKVTFFEMTLSLKHRTEKLKTKNGRYRNSKNQNSEILKLSFSKRIDRKCRLISTRTEQNNNHTRIMHKIQFPSSFKLLLQLSKAN